MYQKSRSYHVRFLRYKVQRTELFVILGHRLPFDPPNNPKNQNFEKIKKNASRYYHFPLVYHKWRYASFLRFRARQTENPGKSNFEKNEKNSWRYCHFTHEYHKWRTINEDHMMYDSEILSQSDKIFTRFGPFFTHLPSASPAHPWQPRESKFWKNIKNTWRYHHFTQLHHKWQSNDLWLIRYEVQQTEFFCHLGLIFALLAP